MTGIDSFFDPERIAVVGASRTEGKVGHAIVKNLNNSFNGEILPVNPKADEILGLACYSSVDDIDGRIDHAIIALPPQIANQAIRQCVEQDVPAVTVVTSGYEEVGGEGQERQDELEAILEDSSTRLIGPNCLGIWDSYTGVDTLFLPDDRLGRPPQGSIALISQSGSVGASFLDMAAEDDIGISRFVSYGNQADVDEADLIRWFADDEKTDAVAVYMEGANDGRKFYRAAEDAGMDKPLIVLKAGKTAKGSEAATSHTGSLAGSYRVYRGAFRQSGVVEAGNVEELFDMARMVAYENPPAGKNVAVVTNGGGYGVLATDSIEETELELAEFSERTEERLEELLPSYGNVTNPLDVLGDADPDVYRQALEIVSDDPNVDMMLSIALLQPATMDPSIVDILADVKSNSDNPLAVCMVGGKYTDRHVKQMETEHIPTFPTPERSVKALEGLYMYQIWRDKTRKN